MSYEHIIRGVAEKAPIGQNTPMKCPYCMARKRTDDIAEKMYVVRELGTIKYTCFSASCGARGILADNTSAGRSNSGAAFVPKRYTGVLGDLDKAKSLISKYHISVVTAEHQGWRESKDYLYMPVFNMHEAKIGECLKRISNDRTKPKNLTYKLQDYPLLHFPRYMGTKPLDDSAIVVVEDIISSIRVGTLQDSAALLGTNLSFEMMMLLRATGKAKLLIFLDADATDKAFHYQRKYGHLMDVRVLPSERGYDPKDLTKVELATRLKRILS